MKKNFILTFIICLCLVLFAGCAKIEAGVRYVVQDGQALIVQSLDITLDKESLALAGYDYDASITQIYSLTDRFMQEQEQKYNWFLNEIAVNETRYAQGINSHFYDSIKTFTYLNSYKIVWNANGNGFRVQKEFGNIYAFMVFNGYNMMYTGCPSCHGELEIDVDIWDYNEGHYISNKYTCPHCKVSQTNYKYYFEPRLVDIPLQGDLTVESNAFVTKYLQECKTMFHNLETLTFNNGDNLVAAFENVFSGKEGFCLEDTDLVYKFTTPYKRVHSNGKVSKQNGQYVHTWNMTDPDQSILISRISAKSTMWYVVALSAAIGMVVIYFALRITFKMVKKHNKPTPIKKEKPVEVITKDTKAQSKKTEKTTSSRLKQKTKEAKNNNLIDIIKR